MEESDKSADPEAVTGDEPEGEPQGAWAVTSTVALDLGKQIGQRVGPYRILEILGEGGMGVVCRAEQTEPVRRIVALKLIKLGMDTKQVIARFEAERQALAMMDHPNVAKVFDAGATDDGRPFFVMEHVAGVPITEHCDRHRLSIDDRLTLFMQVCHAVQHAHQKGIIHRDIKPGNVLVSMKEGEPVAKVIDFGVAKALYQKLTEKTLFTEQGQLIGTPEYMSPEQAEMTAQDIDTRSDIYSLGVLLYELLTGALLFDPKSLRKAAFAEIQRIIREQEPPKPSTKLSSLGDDSTTNADNRRLDPRSLMRELRGDLDWIVMKALEKDRTRRYETANGFALDIQRHLSHEPVLAEPPSATYKLRKFVRRNRSLVVTAITLVTVFVVATLVSISFGIYANTQRGKAVVAQRAESERAAELKKVSALQSDMLTQIDRMLLGQNVRAGVLDEAREYRANVGIDASTIESELRELSDTLNGVNFTTIASMVISEEILTPTLSLVRNDSAIPTNVRITLLSTIAESFAAFGDYETAASVQRDAVDLLVALEGPKPVEVAIATNNLGSFLRRAKRSDEALGVCTAAVEQLRSIRGEDDADTLIARDNLAKVLADLGRREEAAQIMRDVLSRQTRIHGEAHESTLTTAGNLAVVLQNHGDLEEAQTVFESTLAGKRKLLGDLHEKTLITRSNFGVLLVERGLYSEARPHLEAAVDGMRRTLGDRHERTLLAINMLSLCYQTLGHPDLAEPLAVEALGSFVATRGDLHPETLTARHNLATLYMDMNRLNDALDQAQSVLDAAERTGTAHTLNGLITLNLVVALLRDLERTNEALAKGELLVRQSRESLPDGDWRIAVFKRTHARTLANAARYSESTVLFEEAFTALRTNSGVDPSYARQIVEYLAATYEAWHEAEPDKGYDAKAAEWRAELPEPTEAGEHE